MVNQVTVAEFDEIIKNSSVPVVCDFFATWCGPCKMLAPVMEQVSDEMDGKAIFLKVDVDDNMELAGRYSIMSIPLLLVFKGGEVVDKSLGFMSKSEVSAFVQKNL